MSKRFKREKADSSLFHHGLIKLIIVYHLSLHGDSWRAFIARNGFDDTDPVQIDKPVVNETKVEPPVPFHVLLPSPKPSVDPDIYLPDVIAEKAEGIKSLQTKRPRKTLLLMPRVKRTLGLFREWLGINLNPLLRKSP
jgi:hypothetical protein